MPVKPTFDSMLGYGVAAFVTIYKCSNANADAGERCSSDSTSPTRDTSDKMYW